MGHVAREGLYFTFTFKVYNCNDDHTSELAKVARKETAFERISPLTESYRKPLEKEHGLPGVFCDRANASANL